MFGYGARMPPTDGSADYDRAHDYTREDVLPPEHQLVGDASRLTWDDVPAASWLRSLMSDAERGPDRTSETPEQRRSRMDAYMTEKYHRIRMTARGFRRINAEQLEQARDARGVPPLVAFDGREWGWVGYDSRRESAELSERRIRRLVMLSVLALILAAIALIVAGCALVLAA